MAKVTLNGYWTKNDDQNVTLFVDRVYKKGYVTGFCYRKMDERQVISTFRATHQELVENYTKKEHD